METKKDDLLYQDKKLATTTYKCPSCGGEAKFSPKDQKLKCEYCGLLSDVDLSTVIEEQNIADLLEKAVVINDADVYQCSSCGAKEIISKQDIAVSCPFCGTNNIVKTQDLAGIKPQGIVPFKIEKNEVTEIAKKWAKKRRMAPRDFSRIATMDNINGIYNPLFTFDCKTSSKYEGRLGERKQRVRVRNGKTVVDTYIDYFRVSGTHNSSFDDLLIQASEKISQDKLDKISPFSTNDAVTYDTKFLRGYTASSNTKDGLTCWNQAKDSMDKIVKKEILSGYHYDVVDYLNVKTAHFDTSYKYVLVPLYVGVHRYKNKVYNFYVNGLNGKIAGDSPVSIWKVIGIIIISIIVLGIMAFIMMN